MDRGARRTMARDRLLRRHHCRWLRHLRTVRFSADPTLRSRRSCRLYHRHPGKPVRVTITRRRSFEKEVLTGVILDNRIVTKPYGRAFLQALPKCPVEIV